MYQRQVITEYIAKQYGILPDYLWAKFPTYAVFRHNNKKQKWFALIANVPKLKLGVSGNGNVDILNLKCDPELIVLLRQDKHILPAYHMNKRHWFTLILDCDFAEQDIYSFIDWSYRLTA